MPEFIDWTSARDRVIVLDRVRAALDAGGRVVFPVETGCALAVRADRPKLLPDLPAEGHAWSLALPLTAEVAEWVGGLSAPARRLVRRAWPGPVIFEFARAAESGPASQFPAPVLDRVALDGNLALRLPAGDAILNVLESLDVPLVLVEPSATSPEWLASLGEDVDLVLEGGRPVFDEPASRVRIDGHSWEIVRPGVYSLEELRRLTACLILFVCTGNTCRSPMAEAICKVLLAEHLGCGIEDLLARGYWVMSGGVSAYPGDGSAEEARAAVVAFGADLSEHRSRPVRPELAAVADYIVAMTDSHRFALRELFAELGAEPRLLCGDRDLPDPIGGDQAVYDECAQQIRAHLAGLVAEVTGS